MTDQLAEQEQPSAAVSEAQPQDIPSPHHSTEAPTAPDTSAKTPGQVERDLNRRGLSDMAARDSMDDYVNERRDQDALERGDTAPLSDPYRRESRLERYKPILEKMQKAADEALQQEPSAVETRIEDARIEARAGVRIEQYERENPGFKEYVQETVNTYGDVSRDVAKAIFSSTRGPEIIDRMCQTPESIAEVNQLSPRERDIFIARMEGLIDGIGYVPQAAEQKKPPAAKLVSSAPKPVTTIAGKSSQSTSKSPDQLASNMEDYAKYWHARERNAS